MKLRVVAVLAAVLLVAADEKDDVKKELEKFQGAWKVESTEQKGMKASAEDLGLKDFRLVIKGDKFTFNAPGGGEGKGTIKIDPTKKPKTLDSTMADGQGNMIESVGIYEIDKDTLKVCYVFGKQNRPTEFKAAADSEAILVVYKKDKK